MFVCRSIDLYSSVTILKYQSLKNRGNLTAETANICLRFWDSQLWFHEMLFARQSDIFKKHENRQTSPTLSGLYDWQWIIPKAK